MIFVYGTICDINMGLDDSRRLLEIFATAVKLPPDQVERFLRSECGSDESLYAELRHKLETEARTTLDEPPTRRAPLRGGEPVFSAGQIVSDRYRIVRFLSRGGMGEVYEAEDLELRESLALKTLIPAIASDGRMIARFKQEIQLSRKVSHPNVCRVFDLARHPAHSSSPDATVFLTMEFLAGETLSARLHREGRIQPEVALPLLQQMAEALDAAHRAGVIHRDFKPSNVMLAPSPEGLRAVVTDFGLARSFAPSNETTDTLSGPLMGTLAYMAPELLTGGTATIASDVYAFGTTAYEMVTGALPFPTDGPLAILRSKAPAPSPRTLVPELDTKWERAILRALDPDAVRRFTSLGDFVRAIQNELPTAAIVLPSTTRRRLIGAVTAIVVLLAVGFIWNSWKRSRNQPSSEGLRWYQIGEVALRDATYYRAARALERAVSLDPGFALAHARLAETWNELDDSEKAKEEMLRALAAQSSHPPARSADAAYVDAIHRTLVGDFPGAIRTYTELGGKVAATEKAQVLVDLGRARERNDEPVKALEAYRDAARRDAQNAAAHLRAGILLGRQGKLNVATAELDQADSLYKSLSNTEGQTEVLYQRGLLASSFHKLPEARAALDKAIQLARAISTEHQEIASTLQLGVVTYQESNPALAEQISTGAIDKARRAGMANLAARGLTDLGTAQFLKGDYTRAEANFREALDLSRHYAMRRYEARALLSLASLHQKQGSTEGVLKEIEPALAFYRQAGFRLETALCLTAIARAHRDLGKYAEALAEFEQQVSLAQAADDRPQIAIAEQGIASVLFAQERWPDALGHFQRYYELSKSIPNRDGIGLGLVGQAGVLWRLGRYGEAEQALREADTIAGATGNKGPLATLIVDRRASMALSQGLYGRAADLARQAFEMSSATPPVRAANECVAGLALALNGSAGRGKRLGSDCLAANEVIGDRFAVLDARLVMSEILLANHECDNAAKLSGQAAEEFEQTGRNEPTWRAWAVAAEARLCAGDRAGAKEAADRALANIEDLRKVWSLTDLADYLQRPDVSKLKKALHRWASGRK